MLRSKTMIPFQILNFLMHTLYMHSQVLYTEDFRHKVRQEEEHAQKIEEWFEKREKQRQSLDEEMSNKLAANNNTAAVQGKNSNGDKDQAASSAKKNPQAKTFL